MEDKLVRNICIMWRITVPIQLAAQISTVMHFNDIFHFKRKVFKISEGVTSG